MEQVHVLFQVIGVWILRVASSSEPTPFHFINESMSWADAQSYCRVKHSDLATVRDMDDHGRMYNLLELTGAPSSWVGLRRTERRRWRWSDGSGALQTEYVAWEAGEPGNVGGSEWCVEMAPDGTWNDVSCTDPNGYICYELNTKNQVRFVRYTTLTNWKNAQDLCRKTHTDLVTVGSSEITSAIKDLVPTGYQVWIGLFSDAWEWSDGSDASYRFWDDGTEDEGSCAAIQLRGFMATADCEEAKPFFCGGGLKTQKTLVKITLSSTADLQLPKFKIINHMHKQLKTNQVTDFKLYWKKGKDRKVFQRQPGPGSKNEDICEDI